MTTFSGAFPPGPPAEPREGEVSGPSEPARARSEALGSLSHSARPVPPRRADPHLPHPSPPRWGARPLPAGPAAGAPEPGKRVGQPSSVRPLRPRSPDDPSPIAGSKAKGAGAGENRHNRHRAEAVAAGGLHARLFTLTCLPPRPPRRLPRPRRRQLPLPAAAPSCSGAASAAAGRRHLNSSCQRKTATSGANHRPYLAADRATGRGRGPT